MSATMIAEREPATFADLRRQPLDALLALIATQRLRGQPGKLDLGVGDYRDAEGKHAWPQAAEALRKDRGIYRVGSGHNNIAGLTEMIVPHLLAAVTPYLS